MQLTITNRFCQRPVEDEFSTCRSIFPNSCHVKKNHAWRCLNSTNNTAQQECRIAASVCQLRKSICQVTDVCQTLRIFLFGSDSTNHHILYSKTHSQENMATIYHKRPSRSMALQKISNLYAIRATQGGKSSEIN